MDDIKQNGYQLYLFIEGQEAIETGVSISKEDHEVTPPFGHNRSRYTSNPKLFSTAESPKSKISRFDIPVRVQMSYLLLLKGGK